jgi:protein TonB
MTIEAAAGRWEGAQAGRTSGALPGLLPSLALHVAAVALVILWVHDGSNGGPAPSAPQASFVSLVPVLPAVQPEPKPLPQWGLRAAAPEPPATPQTPDPLLEKTPLPEISSEMARLPLAVFATAKPAAQPAPPPEEDAVAIEPAKPVPAPASVKLRKAQTATPAPKPAAKAKPKPVAKPAAKPTAKPADKPVVAAPPVGDPAAKPQAQAATKATDAAPSASAPPSAQNSATASRTPGTAASDAPVLVTNPNYAGTCPIQYPERARRRNQEGTVLIHALIDTDGKPIEVTVAQSSGHSLLDEAAREAIAGCAFVPQRIGGRPVKAIVEIPIPFKLI